MWLNLARIEKERKSPRSSQSQTQGQTEPEKAFLPALSVALPCTVTVPHVGNVEQTPFQWEPGVTKRPKALESDRFEIRYQLVSCLSNEESPVCGESYLR